MGKVVSTADQLPYCQPVIKYVFCDYYSYDQGRLRGSRTLFSGAQYPGSVESRWAVSIDRIVLWETCLYSDEAPTYGQGRAYFQNCYQPFHPRCFLLCSKAGVRVVNQMPPLINPTVCLRNKDLRKPNSELCWHKPSTAASYPFSGY
ncbi:hypothetical protein N1851_018738 [Merluccius polli]|uniref:Uncharacterized protein n=1 Tax=Merluccius polli TaxID=89951 RepID=A0AA47MN92_MERPO|nr:hypothetical protein N1851_018738 [Merluccius polli]